MVDRNLRLNNQNSISDQKSFEVEENDSSKLNKDSEFTISSKTSEASPLETKYENLKPRNRASTTKKLKESKNNEEEEDDESIIGSIKVNKVHIDEDGIEHEQSEIAQTEKSYYEPVNALEEQMRKMI